MPQRNGYRSQRGRSAVARKAMFGGPSGTNGMMPSVIVMTQKGPIRTSYFGGPKKGGGFPSATGFYTPSSSKISSQIAPGQVNKNYLFIFTQYYSKPNGRGGPIL